MITDSYENDYELAVKTFSAFGNETLIDIMLCYTPYTGPFDLDLMISKYISYKALKEIMLERLNKKE